VVCWGDATWGQLAFPATLGVVKEISAGQYFTCVIKQTGELACWGYDANSQVSHLPVGTSYRGLSAGGHHSCVLDETGEIRCWGAGSGQTSQPCSAPYYECGQSIPPPATGYSSLAMGGFQSCALDANGAPSCWGYTLNGVTTPPSLVLFLELSGGLNHACGITNTNTLRCWGWGSATTPGTCASDANCGQSLPPPGTFGYVAAGGRHSCATDLTTGLVSCWGDNSHGQINAPTTVAFRQLSLGTEHSCGITEEGLMQCWGNGSITSTGDCQSNYNCGQSIVP